MEFIIQNLAFILMPLVAIITILLIIRQFIIPKHMLDVKQVITGGIKLFAYIGIFLIVLIMLINTFVYIPVK